MGFARTAIRYVVYLALIAAVVAAIYWAIQPSPIAVDLAVVETGPLKVTVDEDGQTRIRERYVVSAPLSGRLLRLELDPGDPVVQGKTALAIITPRDPELLDARERQQAEMRVKTQEAALAQSLPVLDRAKAALDFAETDMARMEKLGPGGAVSADILDRARMQFRVSQEEYRSALMAQQIAKYELELARAALVRTLPDGEQVFADFEIDSPINGRILRVLQESSTIVTPGTPLVEVGDPTDLEVVVDVLSGDGVRIQPGANVSLERWGGDHPLQGKVRLVEPSAFTKISSLGVEEQRVNVIIDIVDPPSKRPTLGDGFRVETRIVTWETSETLRIPIGALFRQNDKWAVFVREDSVARLRFVEVGHRNDEMAEIVDGLQQDQEVIRYPSDKITDGALIAAREDGLSGS